MSWQKFSPSAGMLAAIVSPVFITFSDSPLQQTLHFSPQQILSLQFPPTQDVGAPPKIMGAKAGGSSCFEDARLVTGRGGLTALTPTNNVVTTVADRPSIFVYVPRHTAQSAEFVLLDVEGNEIYLASLTPPSTPGIVKLSIPDTVSLEAGKNYEWYFALNCDALDRSSDEFVGGLIQRVPLSPDLETKLETVKEPLEQARLYAESRIWHETLTILVSLRDSHPREWQELLESVELEAIAQQSFVDCCIVPK